MIFRTDLTRSVRVKRRAFAVSSLFRNIKIVCFFRCLVHSFFIFFRSRWSSVPLCLIDYRRLFYLDLCTDRFVDDCFRNNFSFFVHSFFDFFILDFSNYLFDSRIWASDNTVSFHSLLLIFSSLLRLSTNENSFFSSWTYELSSKPSCTRFCRFRFCYLCFFLSIIVLSLQLIYHFATLLIESWTLQRESNSDTKVELKCLIHDQWLKRLISYGNSFRYFT